MSNFNGVTAGISGGNVQSAIRNASQQTAVDFDYLIAQARIESSLDPNAKAPTSSAAGLYQFTEQTWLETLNQHGSKYGYDWASQAISTDGGRARVSDPSMRSAIMQLRFDPQAASLMAGELANDNASHLRANLGKQPDQTELYLAHFLGANGAEKFISAYEDNPSQSAAALFPQAAGSNRSIFYSGSGARSLGEVRGIFADKLDRFGGEGNLAGTGQYGTGQFGADPFGINPAGAGQAGDIASYYASRGSSNSSPRASFVQAAQSTAAPTPQSRPSMAQVLEQTFNSSGKTPGNIPEHVSRAYDKIARFGL